MPDGHFSTQAFLQLAVILIVCRVLVPLFFVYTGLRTQLALVDTPSLWT
jgi:Kef-type K+ transport system membrane component KefB